MADYDFSVYYTATMERRRSKLLAAFMQEISKGGIDGLTPSDILATLCTLHARYIVASDGDNTRLAVIQSQAIYDEIDKLQADLAKAA
jgi:hypothetical protein